MRLARLNLPVVSKCLVMPYQGLASSVLIPTYFSAHWFCLLNMLKIYEQRYTVYLVVTHLNSSTVLGGGGLSYTATNYLHLLSTVWKQSLCLILTCCFLPERTATLFYHGVSVYFFFFTMKICPWRKTGAHPCVLSRACLNPGSSKSLLHGRNLHIPKH